MGAVGRQVILNRLIVTYVYEYVIEHSEMGVLIDRREYAALSHVLKCPYSLKAY